jgi:uncharacterized small protein (DUF1192 family)
MADGTRAFDRYVAYLAAKDVAARARSDVELERRVADLESDIARLLAEHAA